MLASDLVRALANRCLRDIFFVRRVAVRMVIAHLLGVTPVLAARRGPNGCRARIARRALTTPASRRYAAGRDAQPGFGSEGHVFRGNQHGGKFARANLPESDPGDWVAHRWRKLKLDEGFAAALADASIEALTFASIFRIGQPIDATRAARPCFSSGGRL
jgi:hypothetical protein